MTKKSNQKLKLLYLNKIMLDKTDEENTLTVNDMIMELAKYGISAERKSIYDDIEALRIFGVDIETRKSKTTDYFIASREFELPELKLLADSVAASKFITVKKSKELIKKIQKLASINQALQIKRQVYVTNRIKTMNESIYYNVDYIHSAIAQKRQIRFKYFEYTLDKEKKYRNGGHDYIVSPCALLWDNENYYLVAVYNKHCDPITNFRVDKMENVQIIDVLNEEIDKDEFKLLDYSNKIFGMFGGDEEIVKLQFDNSLIGVVFDRFGRDIKIQEDSEGSFIINVNVIVSPVFMGWVFQFGDKVKILSPENVTSKIKEMAINITNKYE